MNKDYVQGWNDCFKEMAKALDEALEIAEGGEEKDFILALNILIDKMNDLYDEYFDEDDIEEKIYQFIREVFGDDVKVSIIKTKGVNDFELE